MPSGASGKNRGAYERLGLGGDQQVSDVIGDAVHGGVQRFVIGKTGGIYGFESFERAQVSAIGCLGGGRDYDAGESAAKLQIVEPSVLTK